jgi:hypothetical protein
MMNALNYMKILVFLFLMTGAVQANYLGPKLSVVIEGNGKISGTYTLDAAGKLTWSYHDGADGLPRQNCQVVWWDIFDNINFTTMAVWKQQELL